MLTPTLCVHPLIPEEKWIPGYIDHHDYTMIVRTLSTIALVTSTDGLGWTTEDAQLICPQLEDSLSWKHAYVYGFDTMPGGS